MIYISFWFRLKKAWHCFEGMKMSRFKYKSRLDGRAVKDLGILTAIIFYLLRKPFKMLIDDLRIHRYDDDIKINGYAPKFWGLVDGKPERQKWKY